MRTLIAIILFAALPALAQSPEQLADFYAKDDVATVAKRAAVTANAEAVAQMMKMLVDGAAETAAIKTAQAEIRAGLTIALTVLGEIKTAVVELQGGKITQAEFNALLKGAFAGLP